MYPGSLHSVISAAPENLQCHGSTRLELITAGEKQQNRRAGWDITGGVGPGAQGNSEEWPGLPPGGGRYCSWVSALLLTSSLPLLNGLLTSLPCKWGDKSYHCVG